MAKEIHILSPKIGRLIDQIESGEIKIPPLQRPFVWKAGQILELLESIYKDYPIGSVLLWETKTPLPSTRNVGGFKIPDKDPDYPFYYVLDGQQRLSSLYGVFCKERQLDLDNAAEYRVDTSIFDVLFDLDTECFVHETEKSHESSYISMQILFDPPRFIAALKELNAEQQTIATNLHSQFSNYDIPIVVTKKRSLEEVGIIFERVNNTGSRLDLFDLMVAITWTETFHLQEVFSSIKKILRNKNFEGIKNKIILQCISAVLEKSSKTSIITRLNPKDIRDKIGLVEESLKKTIDYLSTELSVRSNSLLPHAHQIVPMCYFFSLVASPSLAQKKILNTWFWKTSFSTRYSASTDRNIDEDIANFDKLASGSEQPIFEKLSYSITEESLKDTSFSKNNPFSRALVVLLASKHPKNLVNGALIDTGEALSSFNRKEYHHVFPRAFLEGKHVNDSTISSVCNFCILPSGSNKVISDKAPSLYFKEIVPKDNYVEILESNLLPVKKEIYETDNYDLFLEDRAREIINYINKLLV